MTILRHSMLDSIRDKFALVDVILFLDTSEENTVLQYQCKFTENEIIVDEKHMYIQILTNKNPPLQIINWCLLINSPNSALSMLVSYDLGHKVDIEKQVFV